MNSTIIIFIIFYSLALIWFLLMVAYFYSDRFCRFVHRTSPHGPTLIPLQVIRLNQADVERPVSPLPLHMIDHPVQSISRPRTHVVYRWENAADLEQREQTKDTLLKEPARPDSPTIPLHRASISSLLPIQYSICLSPPTRNTPAPSSTPPRIWTPNLSENYAKEF